MITGEVLYSTARDHGGFQPGDLWHLIPIYGLGGSFIGLLVWDQNEKNYRESLNQGENSKEENL